MKPDDFRSRTRIRVRWSEVDPQSIVFNANYLMYVDTASTDYWRALGAPYPDGLSALSGDVYVRKATLEYSAPARFDDVLEVALRCERIGRSSLTFSWAVFRDALVLVRGEIVSVYVDSSDNRPAHVPDSLRAAIEAFEAGQPMFEVRLGDWASLGADAQPIRDRVFVQEQAIDREIERDGADPQCTHVVAYNWFGEAVGTARLLRQDRQTARLGRFAVARPQRGSGVGRALLQRLLAHAAELELREVVLHAQVRAAPFFEQLGFAADGEPFSEAGIDHIAMRRRL